MINKDLLEREELLEDILDALEDGDYEEAEDLADEAIELKRTGDSTPCTIHDSLLFDWR